MSKKDDNRSKAYNDDKRELLKLKQGLIEESDTIKEEVNGYGDKGTYEVVGIKNKVSNFFYHYKWHVIVIAFIAVVTSFLIITTVTSEKGDIRVLAFAKDPDTVGSVAFKTKDFELAFEGFSEDYDDNGYIHTEFYYMNMGENQDYNYYFANQTKLFSEVASGTAQIYMADREMLSEVIGDQTEEEAYVDLSELYPDEPNIVDRYYFKVKGSRLAEAAMYVEGCPENMYIAIRSVDFKSYNQISGDKLAENHSRALEVLDKIINGSANEGETVEE